MLFGASLGAEAAKVPVAILAYNADSTSRTLTFTMAEEPESFATGGVDGTYTLPDENSSAAWRTAAKTITNIVFKPEFAQAYPKSLGFWFTNMSNVKEIEGLQNLNTDSVTTMRSTFYNCSGLTSIDLSHFNTAKVTNMAYTFAGCTSLTSLDLSKLNTESLTSLDHTFAGDNNLTELKLDGVNTSKVTMMTYLFSGLSKITTLDVSGFKYDSLQNANFMFTQCTALTEVKLGDFNAPVATIISNMFNGCTKLEKIDLTSFNAPKANNLGSMFYNCNALKAIDLSIFSIPSATDLSTMFYRCTSLESLDLSKINAENVNVNRILYNCTALKKLNVGDNDFKTAKNTSSMFSGVGTTTAPCTLVVGDNFDKTVLGQKQGDYYLWNMGYFGEPVSTGINGVDYDAADSNAPAYNIGGQRVSKSFRGVVIINGKKYIRK